MRTKIHIEIDTCEKCPHLIRNFITKELKCGKRDSKIPIVLTGQGLDIPGWCPISTEENAKSKPQYHYGTKERTKEQIKQQDDPARQIELD